VPHNISLISTIAVSLLFAFVGGTLATKLRLQASGGNALKRIRIACTIRSNPSVSSEAEFLLGVGCMGDWITTANAGRAINRHPPDADRPFKIRARPAGA